MIDVSQVWKLDEHARVRRLFDEGVLIHQDQAEALVLNDAGMAFLELCDGQRSTTEVIRAMLKQFEVSYETLADDLEPFIQELAKDGIIQAVCVK